MKKQVIYPKFIPRLFSTTLDLFFVALILSPIMSIITQYTFYYRFKDFFVENAININDRLAMQTAMQMPEFTKYFTFSGFISYLIILYSVNFLLMGIYFIVFWRKFGATPGKMLLRMKIVDADDYDRRPTTLMLVKRFLGYTSAFIGMWSILISKKGQAMHDRIAHTVVIKR